MNNNQEYNYLVVKYILIIILLYNFYKIYINSNKCEEHNILNLKYKLLLVSPLLIVIYDIIHYMYDKQIKKPIHLTFLIHFSNIIIYDIIIILLVIYVYYDLPKCNKIKKNIPVTFMKVLSTILLIFLIYYNIIMYLIINIIIKKKL